MSKNKESSAAVTSTPIFIAVPITAPMPGQILSITGTVATVLGGAVIYTMEAMKMQFNTPALTAGVFVAVAAVGVIVEVDDIIGWFFPFIIDESTLAGCGADSDDEGSH